MKIKAEGEEKIVWAFRLHIESKDFDTSPYPCQVFRLLSHCKRFV
jgi:hypothetical protein